jgi:hypothetical protein
VQEYVQPGAIVLLGVGLRLAYKHLMAALERGRLRDDALAKRLVAYEKSNTGDHTQIIKTASERHIEVIDRLSHVEALVDGKEGSG